MHVCILYIMERAERNARSRGSAIPRLQRAALAAAVGIFVLTPRLLAQTTTSPLPLTSAEQVINRNTDPFAGSLTQPKPVPGVIDLSVDDALQMALRYNLGLYLSERGTDEARAARLRALSELLPNVNGSITEQVQRLNIKAFGFNFPGFPSAVGPFGLTDFRATVSNTVDFSSIDRLRSAGQNRKAAQFSYKDARDTVVVAVGANYLLTVAYESRVDTAQADFQTAQALYQLAEDEEVAGLAPNIDTLRARVELQARQEALIQAQNDLEKQRIALLRVIGLPVTQKFRLVNRVPYYPIPEIELDRVYDLALQTRPDYQAALAQLKAAQFNRSAAWKERLPALGLSGEYGVLGYTPNSTSPNWTAAASILVPIFQAGRTHADVVLAEAQLKQSQALVDDLRGRIQQEIQNAILDLRAAAQQVDVATTGLQYAKAALEQSQDRFAAGVTNNVEVIQAQEALASANDQYISSLYAHNIAKVLLARAMGNAEQTVRQYLTQPGNTLPPGAPPTPGMTVPPGTPPPPGSTAPPVPTPPSANPAPGSAPPTGSASPGPSAFQLPVPSVRETARPVSMNSGLDTRMRTAAPEMHTPVLSGTQQPISTGER